MKSVGFVCNPHVYQRLKREVPKAPDGAIGWNLMAMDGIYGLPIFCKVRQRQGAYEFRDRRLLKRYLDDALPEECLPCLAKVLC